MAAFIGSVDVRLQQRDAPSLVDAQQAQTSGFFDEIKEIFNTEGPPATLTEHCIGITFRMANVRFSGKK